ncbi:hypothetical protein LTS17_010373 [Exophiala oligosperma]
MSEAFISNSRQQQSSRIILKHRAASYKTLRESLAEPKTTPGDIIMSFMPMIFADLVLGQTGLQTMHLEALDNYVQGQGGIVPIFLGQCRPRFSPQYLASQYALAEYRIRDSATLAALKENLMGSLRLIQKSSVPLEKASIPSKGKNTTGDLHTKHHSHDSLPECPSSYHDARAAMEDILGHFRFHPSETPSSTAAVFGLLFSFGLTLVEFGPSRSSATRFLQCLRKAVNENVVPEPMPKPAPQQIDPVTAMMCEVRPHLFHSIEPQEMRTATNYNSASLMAIMSKVREDVLYEIGTKESSFDSEVRICNALIHALKIWPVMTTETKAHMMQHLRGWILDGKDGTCTCAVASGDLGALEEAIVRDWMHAATHASRLPEVQT